MGRPRRSQPAAPVGGSDRGQAAVPDADLFDPMLDAPNFDPAAWALPLDPSRQLVTWFGAPGFRILADADIEFVELADGYVIPREFFFLLRRVDALDLVLGLAVEHGELVCNLVSVQRQPGNSPLTATDLRRLNLKRMIRAAGERAGGPAQLQDGRLVIRPAVLLNGDERDAYWSVLQANHIKPHRGKRLEPLTLETVARIYREAMATGSPPTKAVEEALHLSRSTAGRWIKEARRRGFLGPAPAKGVAGGAEPMGDTSQQTKKEAKVKDSGARKPQGRGAAGKTSRA
jgi:hypothetical protein